MIPIGNRFRCRVPKERIQAIPVTRQIANHRRKSRRINVTLLVRRGYVNGRRFISYRKCI